MKRKWAIFKEYYLLKCIIVIMIIVGLIYSGYNRINQKDCVLQVMMMDVRCSLEQQEEFESKVGEKIGLDEQKEYVDISFCDSPEMLISLMVSDRVDVFLMNNSYFEMMISQGCLSPLDKIIDDTVGKSDSLENAALVKGEDGKVYGFLVSDHPWMEQFGFVSTDEVFICSVENTPNAQNADTFIRSLLTE